ncbi:MAG: hypothetical protein IOD12_02270 [Silvanigrellales bacterium]|jgi:hypothetical protein|nr:hypothetical protein [Silvanigrellales bacterium]
MTSRLTPMKVVSLTCEQGVAPRLLSTLKTLGIKSVRITETRVEELCGDDDAVDLHQCQWLVECVVPPEAVSSIIDELSATFLSRYDVGFYVHDAAVLRPGLFALQK